MKTTIALLAVALGASIPLQAATASENSAGISKAAQSQNEDFSAAKKKKRYGTTVYRQPYGYYPQRYSYYYPPAFWPGDPSWQSPQLQRLRAANRCVIDLGYGRWEYCD
jgi:hypothetical protein